MSFVANPFVAGLDANVLFPVRVRDVLLSFAQAGLFRARFTDEILDEWTRTLIRLKPHLEAGVLAQDALIREVFDDCLVTGHRRLIPGLDLPDPDDRHVLAAAIRCGAQVIVTENRRDFPAEVLDEYGLEVVGADDFLTGTYELFPSEAPGVLRTIRARFRRPSMTPSEFLLDLTRCGLPKLAALARRDVEFL